MPGWRDKRRVMQRYDLTADIYEERYSEEQQAKYQAALENVNIVDAAVLDVGCGSGLFFSQVAQQAKFVVGVDLSRKLLIKAKDEAKKEANVFVLQADADHLPFTPAFFDAAFAFTVLQNMPKPNETLAELRRVVKVGCRVVVTGLKKAFSLEGFIDLLEDSGMTAVSFLDREDLKCYIAALTV